MLVLLSPAKKLDFESENVRADAGLPQLMSDTRKLVKEAQKLRAADLKAMMGISDNLADLNVARFKAFKTPFTPANARPALDAFQGDVYVGLDAGTLSDDDRMFANKALRILSGLYGILKPLDLMQAYRLEMGTGFKNERGKNLYAFWGAKISKIIDADLSEHKEPVVINLASNEYFKVVDRKSLKARVITPVFQDVKDGKARVISFFAKKARGMMARYVIENRLESPEGLKKFNVDGYQFQAADSTNDTWVFRRAQT